MVLRITESQALELGAAVSNEKRKGQKSKLEDSFRAQIDSDVFFGDYDLDKSSIPINPDTKGKKRKFRYDFIFHGPKVAVEIQGGSYGKIVKCHRCKSNVYHTKTDGSMSIGKAGKFIPVRVQGGHQTADKMARDSLKSCLAAEAGYVVLPFTGTQVQNGEALKLLRRVIKSRS